MTMRLLKRATVAEFRHETNILRHLSTRLETLARVLSHVQTVDEDQDPTIKPDDMVCLMELFQEDLSSLRDLAETLDRVAERDAASSLKAGMTNNAQKNPIPRRTSC
jgi:hypothetical protein